MAMTEAEFKKLPLTQRKAIQQRLKDANLYAGGIDGNWGGGTEAALKQEERSRIEGEERSRKGRIEEEAASAEAEKKKAEADRERAKAEAERAAAARKAEYDKEAGSALGVATQIGTNTLAPLAGYGVGRGIGSGLNALADRSQNSKNAVLNAAAEDRLKGLTTREGARTGTTVSGAMPSQNSLLRVGGRMLPHAITGTGMIAKGGAMLSQGNEDDPFYAQMANRAAGLGMLGTGVGIIEQGANYAVNPGVAPDARAIAIMESNQLRRGGLPGGRAPTDRGQIIDADVVPDPPAQKALPAPDASQTPQPGSKAYYAQEAKRLGVKGVTRKTKAELVEAVNQANAGNATKRVRTPKAPAVAGPLAAAGLAYMATPNDANASTGDDSVTGQDEALTNAALAGGAAYGMGRLIPPGAGAIVGGAMGPVSAMTGPDFTPESEQYGRNAVVRDMPFMRHVASIYGDAYDMAQVPQRSPVNSGPRNALTDGRPFAVNALQQSPAEFDAVLRDIQALLGE